MSFWTVEVHFAITVEATTEAEAIAAAKRKLEAEAPDIFAGHDIDLDPWPERD